MQQALRPVSSLSGSDRQQRAGTRADAIVFAWVLDLPPQIHSTEAARAVLDVVRPQLIQLNGYQRSIVAELTKLMRTEESTWTSIPAQKSALRFKASRRMKGLLSRSTDAAEQPKQPKPGKWVLLPGGRD